MNEVSRWTIDGNCLFLKESEGEFPIVFRLSAIESIYMRDEDVVVVQTRENEYAQRVDRPRDLITRFAEVLRGMEAKA